MGLWYNIGPSRREAARIVRDHNESAWGEPSLLHAFEQFRRMPALLPSLEFCLGYGVLCCLRVLLEVLLMPLRLLCAPWAVSRRDVLTAYLVLAGLMPFILTVSTDAPMYLYSFWYHAVRGTSILKLYVIFNLCDMCEKMLASFNHDATEALWFAINSANAAEGPPRDGRGAAAASKSSGSSQPPPATRLFVVWMLVLSFASTAAHAFLLMLQTVTLNAALNSDDYSLIALLISNNFMEIKSLVFKKCSVEQLFQHVCTDTVERVQQLTHMAVMLLRHAQSQGFGTVQPLDLVTILLFEVGVDFTKHFFLARYNRISLDVYERFRITIVWDAARTYLADELASRALLGRGIVSVAPAATSEDGAASATDPREAPVVRRLTADDRKALRSIHSPDSFVRNPARRLGFTPYANAAVILWAGSQVGVQLATQAPAMCVIAVALLLALHSVIATIIDGAACRFAIKSNRWQKLAPNVVLASPRPLEGTARTPPRRHENPSSAGTSPNMTATGRGDESDRPGSSGARRQQRPTTVTTVTAPPALMPPSPAKEDPLNISDGSSPAPRASGPPGGLTPVGGVRPAHAVTNTLAKPLSAAPRHRTGAAGDSSSDVASRRASGLTPQQGATAPLSTVTSPLLARRRQTLGPSSAGSGASQPPGSGTPADPLARSVPSSGTTSPQATFTQFAGPTAPAFMLGGSLDERVLLARGASLAGPPSDTGGSQAPASPGAVPDSGTDGAARARPDLGAAEVPLPSGAGAAAAASGGDSPPPPSEGEAHPDPWAGLEPMDSIYPFQRVDGKGDGKDTTAAHRARHEHHAQHHRSAGRHRGGAAVAV
uniref:Uncharacterized protein n=1 Tax=Neobodo designis TaxID=312471 RepID=A0A7S1MK87_NEODS|mmetsp:Transcript_4222/g.13483  ORF Transcript_4222/g.13483 Transcript_4222/m.13483 type:complete len:830 (+) Transcript_4222:105-2594(+)